MLGHRELSFDDYVEMLRRRLWIILIPALIAPLIAYLISLKIPNKYTSETLVLVEQPKVPTSFVKSVVTEDLDQRLAMMSEQILSRTRLQPIIERFGLFKDEGGKPPVEELVLKMRKAISVRPVTSEITHTGGVPGFYISFTTDNARLAQQVCAEITTMFMEENLRSREQSAQGTTEFLRKQLDDAKRKLDEQDARMAEFKTKYIGQLPGQEQMNMNVLMGLSSQLDAVSQAISRAQQDKTYAESLLAQQVAAWEATKKTGSANPATLEQQLALEQSQFVILEARYTPDHPDVVKMKNDIAQLKKKIDEAQAASDKPSSEPKSKRAATEPPEIQQLRYQVRQLDQTVKDKSREQVRIQQQIGLYQGRVQLSPTVDQQFKELSRDYQIALSTYNDLLNKKTQSEIATDLERRQQGEQFRVMDPPNLPEKPSFPDRRLFALGGLGIGLGLGFGITLLIELLDKSLRSEKDVEFYLELPALAVLPTVGEVSGNGHKPGFWMRAKKLAAQSRQSVGV